jgi:hypothetical protein
LRGLAEGHYPWDLESKPNMMTNANISKCLSEEFLNHMNHM